MSSTTIDTIINQIGKVMSEWQGFEKRKLHTAKKGGELLLKAKKEVGHGGFRKWLWTNFPNFSERTLQTWMRVAERWQDLLANPQYRADMGLADALSALASKGKGQAGRAKKGTAADTTEDAEEQGAASQAAKATLGSLGEGTERVYLVASGSADVRVLQENPNCTLTCLVEDKDGVELGRCRYMVTIMEDEEEAAEEEVHAQEVT